ncbi:MAG TPA: hypothetical protein VGM06_11395 [Polyangiaceae bacterium]|jgi:hypothetical protein
MNFRIAIALILGSSATVGCFQTIDNGVVGGGSQQNATAVAPTIGKLVDAGFPTAFGTPNLTEQCEAGSELCYQLCDSPECATDDGGGGIVLPPVLQTPAVVLPDGGGESTNPCDQLEAMSMQIRTNSCSQCHSQSGAMLTYTFVLDDNALVTQVPSGLNSPLVIPGKPDQSAIIQKMALGLAGGQLGMPPQPSLAKQLSPLASTIVYPTAEDLSIMDAWILACVPGADGGTYAAQYGGGNYGPEGGSTVSVSATPVTPPPPAPDAGN